MSGFEEAMALFPVLLVEDDHADARLVQELFKSGRLNNPLHIVEDGPEALEFLWRTGRHTGAVRPSLILLDLNLPRMNGREVLARIKEDPALRDIPVVILSSSEEDIESLKAYGGLAVRCLTKPMSLRELLTTLQAFEPGAPGPGSPLTGQEAY